MNKLISATTTLAATVLALISGAAPASAQTAPEVLISTNMRHVAGEYGDQNGHLVVTNAAGGSEIFVYGPRSFVIYTAGDSISSGDTFAFCSYSAAAGLSSCAPLDLSAGGGSTEYECHYFPGDGWCQCSGASDCIKLAASGKCTAEIDCDGDECFCANW